MHKDLIKACSTATGSLNVPKHERWCKVLDRFGIHNKEHWLDFKGRIPHDSLIKTFGIGLIDNLNKLALASAPGASRCV